MMLKKNQFYSCLVVFFLVGMGAQAQSEFILSPYPSCKPYEGLVDNKDGTLTDPRNELVWNRCDVGTEFIKGKGCVGKVAQMSWVNAMKVAKQYRGGGHTNWRLPSQDELMQISDSYDNCSRYGEFKKPNTAAVDLRMLAQQYYDSSHYIATLEVYFIKAWGGSFRMFPQPLREGFNPMNASGEDINSGKSHVRLVRQSGSVMDQNLTKANELYVKHIDEPAAKANQERLARNAAEDARAAMLIEQKKKLDKARQ